MGEAGVGTARAGCRMPFSSLTVVGIIWHASSFQGSWYIRTGAQLTEAFTVV